MEFHENHQQGDGGAELSDAENEGLPVPESADEDSTQPAEDTKEAQPSIEREGAVGGSTGTSGGGEGGTPASPGAVDGGSIPGNSGDANPA